MSPASVASVSRESCRDWLWEITVAPVNMALPPEAPTLASPPGVAVSRPRESTRVDGNVGAIRGVGGGDQFGAVFLAGLRDAAGELNDGFFAGNSIQNFAQRFDGGELAVGIEDVEFGVVGGEGRAGVLGDGGFAVGRGGRVGQLRQRRFVAGDDSFRRLAAAIRDRW